MPAAPVSPAGPTDFKDPYYDAVVGLTVLPFLMLVWAATPWFPWRWPIQGRRDPHADRDDVGSVP